MRTISRMRISLILIFLFSPLIITAQTSCLSCIDVESHQKISDTEGNFTGILDNGDFLGRSVDSIGDFDGDGVTDIVTGAFADDDGGTDRGAVWLMFMNIDGTVKTSQKISSTQGGFTGVLSSNDYFGISVASIGDLDGDLITDIAVGAHRDDDGGTDKGAVWILFLNANGTVKAHQKISDTQGGFTGILDTSDIFGASVTPIGDLDGDNFIDIAVGAYYDDDGGSNNGAIWILFLNSDGTVKSHQKISATQGNFTGILEPNDYFGVSCEWLGDLNGDGTNDLAVGATRDDDGGTNRGAVWILFLNNNGTVNSHVKISDTQGNFTGVLYDFDELGISIARSDDINGDGTKDLIVGSRYCDDGGIDRGAVWILCLDSNGTVDSQFKISDTISSFSGILDNSDNFGMSLAPLGDLDNNGIEDFVVGALYDDDGGTDRGALWILFLEDTCSITNPDSCYLQADFTADTVCIGDSTSFTDLSIDSLDTIIVWQWFFGDGNSVMGIQNPVHLYSTADTFIVMLIVTNDATIPCFDTIIKPVIVNEAPTVSIAGNTIICNGDTATLTASGGTGYLWNTGATTASIVVNPVVTTTYSVITSNGSCSATDSITVTVNSAPSVSITGNTTICVGDSTVLTASGGTSYLWNTGDTTATINASPSSTTTYLVTVFDGCTFTDSVTVTVVQFITADAGADVSVCFGDSIMLSASGGTNYSWSPAGGLNDPFIPNPMASPTVTTMYTVTVANGSCVDTDSVVVNILPLPSAQAWSDSSICSGDTMTISASGAPFFIWSTGDTTADISVITDSTTIYSVVVYDSSGCADTGSVLISVLNGPVAYAGEDTLICIGDSIVLSASGGVNYLWSTGEVTSVITVSPDTLSSFYVTVFDTMGCRAIDTVMVDVAVQATAVANALPNGGCTPLTVNFINNSTPNDSSLTFFWDFGDPASGTLNSDSAANPSHIYVNPGSYSVILTITSGACSSIQAVSDTIIINISSGPVANMSFDPEEAFLLSSTVTFVDNSTGGTYCILITGTGDTLIPCDNSYTYLEAGTYTVTQIVYDSLGCSDTTTGVIYIKPDYILFVPNSFTPNGDEINDFFLSVGIGVKTFELYIFNRWGDQIFESLDMLIGWDGRGNDGEFVAQNEVYVYRIYTIDYMDMKHEYVGKIVLLR